MKGITNTGERKDSVEALLHQTNLWAFRKKALITYSGGMKQRSGIAQALLGKPRLMIVDEPTAGLDPGERNRFLNLLSSIGRDITIILSTHIVEDVRELCPRMAIMAAGRTVDDEDDDEERIAATDGKSILDIALGQHQPIRRLRGTIVHSITAPSHFQMKSSMVATLSYPPRHITNTTTYELNTYHLKKAGRKRERRK
jgi:ABC-type multidrug transport system ATPase subunit